LSCSPAANGEAWEGLIRFEVNAVSMLWGAARFPLPWPIPSALVPLSPPIPPLQFSGLFMLLLAAEHDPDWLESDTSSTMPDMF